MAQVDDYNDIHLYDEVGYSTDLVNRVCKDVPILGIVRGVSKSGMTHYISYVAVNNGEVYNLTYAIALLTGYKMVNYQGRNAVKMHGYGYDKVFQLVYELGKVLHSNGDYFKLQQI
jgi:hypothetical protein